MSTGLAGQYIDSYQDVLRLVIKEARFDGLVITASVAPHVPIPNTTVKPDSADGTAS